ncbi:MAG TPA: phosphotransferase [Casimicrobiaceae bacterium]|nr:phosphotransferase [Casimicrobiaceae bacterium]
MAGGPVEAYVGTMPVPEKHRIDAERLESYLRAHIPGFAGPLEIEQFRGGQSNPTYRLSAGAARYVLRRKPPGKLLPSAHAIDREYRVMTALRASGVPVPQTLCLCEDDAVAGTAFYVMEYVDGRVFWDPALPGVSAAERGAIFGEMNRVIAALHRADYRALGLENFGRPGGYLARQIARWTRQYRASETERIDAMERLIEWLPGHIPSGDETAIVHGDYRLDNLVFHPIEPRILAVLDWELSTLGHPLADFAYHCMSWRVPAGTFRGMLGLALPALGIPLETEYAARYCERTGRGPVEPREWEFYIAYNMFRAAAIAQGIMGRARDGTASSAHALEAGRSARSMAERGWQQVEKLLDPR